MIHRSLVVLSLLLYASSSYAYIFPYSVRTRDYSSWTPATYGDISTIGMAGATLAVPMSISSAESNPAGIAMLAPSVFAQINSVTLDDAAIQRSGDTINNTQWGLGLAPGLWGISLAYYSPETETGTYVSPNIGDTTRAEVSLRELQFTIAHSFFEQRLSIAFSPELLRAIRQLDDASSSGYGKSYGLSALYRFPRHVLLGVSYFPQATVGPSSHPDAQVVMPGFNRSVIKPSMFGSGLGWIPNRYFKIATSLTYVGATQNTALLADQSVVTGSRGTLIPRLGASYLIAEYPNFTIEGSAGSYYEVSRLSDSSNRLHATAGIEANPYFVNTGAGFDISSGYKNVILSIGFDIVRAAMAFNIIPKSPSPPPCGVQPNICFISGDGLPDGLTAGERNNYRSPDVKDVVKIVEDIPGNVRKKIEGQKTTVEIKDQKEEKEAAPQ